jgi:hypothetical protein
MAIEPELDPSRKGPRDAKHIENVIEHAFLSALLEYCWFTRHIRVEVIRPDVDSSGYDLVLEVPPRIRHAQLKARHQKASGPMELKITSRLREHEDPCVIWIFWEWDTAARRVRLTYRYSPRDMWPDTDPEPDPDPGEPPKFRLTGTHFLPKVGIADLATHLFDLGPGNE